jgi:hypothetical protein
MRAAWSLRRSVATPTFVFALALALTSVPAAAAMRAEQALAGLPNEPRTAPLEQPEHPALRVSEIRLEPAPATEVEPSAVLRFNLENHGITQLADVVLRIAVYTEPSEAEVPRAIVRPFTLHTDATLEPGYSVDYEMRFRNLTAGCHCVPKVEVVSAKAPRY